MSRRFGVQINGERKALGALPIQGKQTLLKPLQTVNPSQSFHDLKAKLHHLVDQENQDYVILQSKNDTGKNFCQESFTIQEDPRNISNDEGVYSQDSNACNSFRVSAEEILDQSYEAMKKNLNSFLIDSEEKFEEKENISIQDESLISIDCDSTSKTIEISDDEAQSSELMEHSDCSLAPPIPFSSLDLFQDYSRDVLEYCLKIERSFMADPYYMAKQPEINGKMRAILVDWLFDVSDEYNLEDETLFLAVQYVDRYLSRASITRSEFQLLGISALFIASKYEEIYPPELHEFAYTTDDSATKAQILAMEKKILKVLDFDVSCPTSLYFLKKFATDLNADKEEYYFAKYLCTLSLMEPGFLSHYPSEIAFSCILLTFRAFGRDIPSDFLTCSLDYEKSLGPKGDVLSLLNNRNTLISQLSKLQQTISNQPQQSILKKYSSPKYFKVAKKAVN